ncbi:MAG: BamA/TamA family outer membrane protein [Cyclobacteriaceae bacterium]
MVLLSCSSTRYLEENEYLLSKQHIKGIKKIPVAAIEGSLKQKVNKDFLFPGLKGYVYLYNTGKKFYRPKKAENKLYKKQTYFNEKLEGGLEGSKKYIRLTEKKEHKTGKLDKKLRKGNLLMRVGEAPVIYRNEATISSISQIKKAAQIHGFPNATVEVQKDTSKKKIKLSYTVKENNPLIVKSFAYTSHDKRIERLVNRKKTISAGERYKEEKLSKERERVYSELKNNGYFEFQRQYVYFEIDTGNSTIDSATIKAIVETPERKRNHNKYRIGKVVLKIDLDDATTSDTVDYKSIIFINTSTKYSKKFLNSYIFVRPEGLYRQKNIKKTQQRLSDLDIFRYIDIQFDTAFGNVLDIYITAKPFQKYQFASEAGVSVRVSQGNGLPGPFVNLSLKDRKVFKGFEIFEVSTRYALQGQSSVSDPDIVLRSREFGVNTSLTFPRLIVPLKRNNIFSEYSPKTQLSLGYSDIVRPEYNRKNFQFTFGYSWTKNIKRSFSLNPVQLSFVNTTEKTDAFNDYLETLRLNGNNLFQSFQPSLVSSIFFDYTLNTKKIHGSAKPSKYFNLFIEPGGFSVNAYTKKDSVLGVPYFQFARIGADFRYYEPVGKQGVLVSRIELALASPLGNSSTLPYEKFYFSGGSNSNRAWFPRRLGPGSYSENAENNFQFEQPGEILLEMNLELRKRLFSFVHGALFIDAGNIWTFETDNSRPGSAFGWGSFINDIAIGSGAGLRLDFSFLIVRFDVGLKIKDPARKPGDRWVPFGTKGQTVFNLGIGNPF